MVNFDREGRIRDAKNFMAEGGSETFANLRFDIPQSTLSYRVHSSKSRSEAKAETYKLSDQEKNKLVNWILHEKACGRAPMKIQVRQIAEALLGPKGTFGKHWVDRFIARHDKIHTKKSRVMPRERLEARDRDEVREFFPLLAAVRAKYKIQPANEYNMDETGVQEGEQADGTVVGSSETARARLGKSGATSWVSILEYIGFTHGKGTAAYIFSGLTVQKQWLPEDIEKAEYTLTPKGWTNNVVALEWLESIFLPETKPRFHDEWRLLILDGHVTYVSPTFMWKCFENKVALMYFPPHSNGNLQPLDVAVFSVLKKEYRIALREAGGLLVTAPEYKRRMLKAYREAAEIAFTDKNIKAGWRYTGLLPFRPEMVLEDPEIAPQPAPEPKTPPEQMINSQNEVVYTPYRALELRKSMRTALRNQAEASRDVRKVVTKAAKGLDDLNTENAIFRHDNQLLRTKLEKYEGRKRQTVTKQPNKIFANLSDIRSAEDKATKRLKPIEAGDQVPIDSYIEKPPAKKRQRKAK
ncbi:hypothetical protein DL763_003450 [Monosporascus cannonballus]|nr:hypothetical protein DL763_003450 [Monosporascus cannonballus]